jgi:hypothetical protein
MSDPEPVSRTSFLVPSGASHPAPKWLVNQSRATSAADCSVPGSSNR